MKANRVWATPDAEKLLAYIARVSNPKGQRTGSATRLIRYMIRNKHWSPFEMVNLCVELDLPRDIARQLLRHRSFSFQEFSQRYQDVSELPAVDLRETRMQDQTNRQSSLPCEDADLVNWWSEEQTRIQNIVDESYQTAIERGIAKECARVILPEGLTPSRMYVNGTLRSWMHYVAVRLDPSTQKEHRMIAALVEEILIETFPHTMMAMNDQ